VPGKSTYVIKALRLLIDEGYVQAERAGAQKQEHVSIRPYVEHLDARSDRYVPEGSGSVDSPPPEDRNPFPFPIGGETGKGFLNPSPGNGGKWLGNGETVPSTTDESALGVATQGSATSATSGTDLGTWRASGQPVTPKENT